MVATPRSSVDAAGGGPRRADKQWWKGIYAMPVDSLKKDEGEPASQRLSLQAHNERSNNTGGLHEPARLQHAPCINLLDFVFLIS